MTEFKKLTDEDFKEAAKDLKVSEALIRAVVAVESNGSGFLPNGRCRILFEPHIFSRLTGHRYDSTEPDISRKGWSPSFTYGSFDRQWDRLQTAVRLDAEAGYQSASWGLFQILGTNYRACGFKKVGDFVIAMDRHERDQLKAFIAFLRHNRLDIPLKNQDWATFARGYNGAGYAKHYYDLRLKEAFLALEPPKGDTYRVTASALNARYRPTATAAKRSFSPLPQGQEVLVIGSEGDWLEIFHRGLIAYIHGDYAEKVKPAKKPKKDSKDE